MTAAVITAQLRDGMLVLDLVQVPNAEHRRIGAILTAQLRLLGCIVAELGDAGDEMHVLMTGDPDGTIANLTRCCAQHGIELRDLSPRAPDNAPTEPYHRETTETVVVDDPDASR